MKDNLPYFTHDNNAHRHPKMKALMAQYGYEGYGRFWVLNERIAESSNVYIDISLKINKLDLANELGFDGDGLDKFLNFLSDPEIDLINIKDNKISTDRVSKLFSKLSGYRDHERDKKRQKKGKNEIPEGKDDFPEGNTGENEDFPPEKDTDKIRSDQIRSDKTRLDEIKTKQDSGGSNEPSLLSESQKQALELSELLLTSHRKEFPDYLSGKNEEEIKKKIEGWAMDIEELIRIDKKDPEIIKQVILWVKTPNNFWFHNIESGAKLRKQFERLYGEMVSKQRVPSNGTRKHHIASDNIPQEKISSYFRKG